MPRFTATPRRPAQFRDERRNDRPYRLIHDGPNGGVWVWQHSIDGLPRVRYRLSVTVKRKWVHIDFDTAEAAIAAADGKVLEVAA